MDVSTYFISDLHLREEDAALNECFFAFLDSHAAKAKRLVINGDFVNAWWGRSQVDSTFANQLKERFAALEDQCEVHFINGNRDFLLSADASFLHMMGHGDGLVVSEHDQRIAVTHGDQFCLDDRGHQIFRTATRILPLHTLSRILPASTAKSVAAWLRNKSKKKQETSRERPYRFFDLNDSAMRRHLGRNKAQVLIVGHIHKPQERHLLVGSSMRRVLVLSDWKPEGAIIAGVLESGETELLELKNNELSLWEHPIRATAQLDKGNA